MNYKQLNIYITIYACTATNTTNSRSLSVDKQFARFVFERPPNLIQLRLILVRALLARNVFLIHIAEMDLRQRQRAVIPRLVSLLQLLLLFLLLFAALFVMMMMMSMPIVLAVLFTAMRRRDRLLCGRDQIHHRRLSFLNRASSRSLIKVRQKHTQCIERILIEHEMFDLNTLDIDEQIAKQLNLNPSEIVKQLLVNHRQRDKVRRTQRDLALNVLLTKRRKQIHHILRNKPLQIRSSPLLGSAR